MIRAVNIVDEGVKRLNSTLEEYAKLVPLSCEQIVEKKARDLGIKIWQGFWKLRPKVPATEKGGNAVFSGPIFREAANRGWRVRVRVNELLGEYKEIYDSRKVAKTGKKRWTLAVGGLRPLSKRALLVAQELAMRQRGAGLLGVSFLVKRWRRRAQAKGGPYLVRNTSGKLGILSMVQKTSEGGGWQVHIHNRTPGVAFVEGKQGIISTALELVRADTMAYIERKQMEQAQKLFKQ